MPRSSCHLRSRLTFRKAPTNIHGAALRGLAQSRGSFDGGDQGLLNRHFSDWATLGPEHRLPFTYNMTSTTYEPSTHAGVTPAGLA